MKKYTVVLSRKVVYEDGDSMAGDYYTANRVEAEDAYKAVEAAFEEVRDVDAKDYPEDTDITYSLVVVLDGHAEHALFNFQDSRTFYLREGK